MVLHDATPHLVLDGGLRRWTHAGYGEAARAATVTVLTPRAAVETIAAGYEPALHPTAIHTVA